MIDLNKFEKIEGGFIEALSLMDEGKHVFNDAEFEYLKPNRRKLCYINNGKPEPSIIKLNLLAQMDWYIPKPFDVRQAMRDKPDEWVGAFKHQGSWHKIGFNLNQMEVVVSTLKSSALVKDCSRNSFNSVDASFLDSSIDLNDVPLEAVL